MAKYAYEVEYFPTSRSDSESWDVIMEATNSASAHQEMERRYPAHVEPDAFYRFFPIPLDCAQHPIILKP